MKETRDERFECILVEPQSPYVAAYLDLVCEALRPYFTYVYRDLASARQVVAQLHAQGVSEFAAPYAKMLIDRQNRAPVAISIWLTPGQLRRERLKGALVMSGLPILRQNPDIMSRMKEAATTLTPVSEDDYYFCCLSVAPAYRRQGIATLLIAEGNRMGRRLGKKRLLLEVNPQAQGTVDCYMKQGYRPLTQVSVYDSQSGNRLENLHMACELPAPQISQVV